MSITKSETKQSIPVTMSLHMRTDQEHTPRSPASSTETYTDPNTSGGRGGPPPDLWPAELSASFASIADQLQKASRTLAAHAAADQQEALRVRVDAVERAQERLAGELAALRNLHGGESCAAVLPNTAVASSSYSRSTTANLERRLADMLAAQKLDQGRLYARLQNSRVTVAKMPIMALPTVSGKPPPDHPRTKGEFEHLTKERYDGLLQAYDQPIEGDTAANRETLRIFLGLPA